VHVISGRQVASDAGRSVPRLPPVAEAATTVAVPIALFGGAAALQRRPQQERRPVGSCCCV